MQSSEHTTLVLGAGASRPYGFSLGRQLKDTIVERLKDAKSTFHEILLACGFEHRVLREFGDRLDQSPLLSVDAFLERAPDCIEVGKHAIALQIAFEEAEVRNSGLKPVDGHPCWYSELYRSYGNQLDDYRPDRLTIVTFNYDRSLREFFRRSLIADFGCSSEAALSHAVGVQGLHVHGYLGDVPFGHIPTAPELRRAAERIFIVSDVPEQAPPALKTARHMILNKSRRVVFLGFGYLPLNIQRLQIANEHPPDTFGARHHNVNVMAIPNKLVLGTTVGMSEQQIRRAREEFKVSTQLANPNVHIAQYLRDHVFG